jgi:GntR family transcriptional regulator of vanillate catabolism
MYTLFPIYGRRSREIGSLRPLWDTFIKHWYTLSAAALAGGAAGAHDSPVSGGNGVAQSESIILRVRELVLGGELAPGQRVTEVALAERLGVSRTPVRQALATLAQEGLLVPAGARGYLVRAFTLKDIMDAIELRGALEGMAARLVAENGPSVALLRELDACLAEGEAIVRRAHRDGGEDTGWSEMNGRFHDALIASCGNQALISALALNDKLPFASARALLGGGTDDGALLARHREVLLHAHLQHCSIVEALKLRQGARAESLMREHALAARSNIMIFQPEIPAMANDRSIPALLRSGSTST